MSTENNSDDGNQQLPIHGDILEFVFSRLPLVQLIPSCHVSLSWNGAVSSSLLHLNKLKPWLIVHSQSKRAPHAITMHAYDPRSDVWIRVNKPPVSYISAIRSSHSTLLYMLSPSKFSFSVDPINLEWRQLGGPVVWRTDPIVAVVGQHVVISGGTCDFEDDPFAVETYDLENGNGMWERSESMPTILKHSSGSTWLSVATSLAKMYLSEKRSGATFSFVPNTGTWSGPYNLRPIDDDVVYSEIGFVGDRMILVGILRDGQDDDDDVNGVKVWEVINGGDESLILSNEVGVMPTECLEKLRGEGCFGLSSLNFVSMGNLVFLYNAEDPGDFICCEMVDGFLCGWKIVQNSVVGDENRTAERFAVTCSTVKMEDLIMASRHGNCSFCVKEN